MTPDNCLEYLRYRTLKAGKRILITTYGIRRSFWLLDPAIIDAEIFMYASTLDGIGKVGRCISVDEICLSQIWLDVLITGTGAINEKGVRFGKGHEYFDLEWAILSATMVSGPASTTVAVVHDCQVLKENLKPEIFDIACDLIITPTRTIHVEKAQKPDCGILWDKLQPGMLEDIRPLQELKMVEDAH